MNDELQHDLLRSTDHCALLQPHYVISSHKRLNLMIKYICLLARNWMCRVSVIMLKLLQKLEVLKRSNVT
jgi:hypothetical protein